MGKKKRNQKDTKPSIKQNNSSNEKKTVEKNENYLLTWNDLNTFYLFENIISQKYGALVNSYYNYERSYQAYSLFNKKSQLNSNVTIFTSPKLNFDFSKNNELEKSNIQKISSNETHKTNSYVSNLDQYAEPESSDWVHFSGVSSSHSSCLFPTENCLPVYSTPLKYISQPIESFSELYMNLNSAYSQKRKNLISGAFFKRDENKLNDNQNNHPNLSSQILSIDKKQTYNLDKPSSLAIPTDSSSVVLEIFRSHPAANNRIMFSQFSLLQMAYKDFTSNLNAFEKFYCQNNFQNIKKQAIFTLNRIKNIHSIPYSITSNSNLSQKFQLIQKTNSIKKPDILSEINNKPRVISSLNQNPRVISSNSFQKTLTLITSNKQSSLSSSKQTEKIHITNEKNLESSLKSNDAILITLEELDTFHRALKVVVDICTFIEQDIEQAKKISNSLILLISGQLSDLPYYEHNSLSDLWVKLVGLITIQNKH